MTPVWVSDAVFYQIFPDRFALSRNVRKPKHLEAWDAPPTALGFKGGDLEGVRERLDYIQDLGITALYFTPVFQSAANHRYHTHDYLQIDPLLGGNKAFKSLLRDAHARGIRIVLDGVFNHASRGFFQFNHTLENGPASPYLDWFSFNREWLASGRPLNAYEPMPTLAHGPTQEAGLERLGYRAWWDLAALPKFNFSCNDVRDFILDVAEYWINEGIDGWRLDVPGEIEDDFWPQFRERVKRANPEAYIVGEIWGDASRWLRGDQFDAVMNYLFGKAVLGFALRGSLDMHELHRCGGYRDIGPLSAEEYAVRVDAVARMYPQSVVQAQLNLLSSHDTPRLWTMASGEADAIRLALFLLFTFPGAPCIYYGEEIALPGGHDPECRAGFPWDKKHWNLQIRDYVKSLAATRRQFKALRRGSYETLHAQGDVYAFERRCENEAVIGVVNVGRTKQKLTLPGISQEIELGPRESKLISLS